MSKWRRVLGTASLAVLPGAMTQAWGFGLGHAVVHSALGQPLSADIAITEASPDELASLRAALATPAEFDARGMSFSSALSGVTVTVQHRPDGSLGLHLAGSRPVQDPYVELLLRARWSSGEISRAYTLLFDPPSFRTQGAATTPIAVQAPAEAQGAQAPAAPTAPAAAPAPVAAASAARPARYRVQRGQTLSDVARAVGAGPGTPVSLDQMLAALYRANSGAFIGGNMNRLRAGSVLAVPSVAKAESVPQRSAHDLVVAQSADFAAYRRRLAGMAGQTGQVPAASRQASGKIQAEVTEPATAASAPTSRLELSKPGSAGGHEAQAAATQAQARSIERQLAEARANVEALSRLAAQASAAAHAAAVAPSAAPHPGAVNLPHPAATASHAATPAPTPTPAAAPHPASAAAAHPASAPVKPASAASAAHAASAASQAAAPKPARPAHPPHRIPAPPAPAAPWWQGLLDNPLPVLGGFGVALLLAVWAWMRRKSAAGGGESSVFDSRVTSADSFFGGAGGERVDTNNTSLGSSVAYSPSQLDGADVDPVAEADVYLAYGRDLQAEEILKEALKSHPERHAARVKLLEIYARRKDVRSFELVAGELFAATEGVGDDWKKAQDLGRALDPSNPLYSNTVVPPNGPTTIPRDFEPTGESVLGAASATVPPTELLSHSELPSARHGHDAASEAAQDEPPAGSGLDMDLDLSGIGVAAAAAPSPEPAKPAGGSLDFDLSDLLEPAPAPAAPAAAALDLPELPPIGEPHLEAHGEPESASPSHAAPAAPAHDAHAPLDFDLGALSLDIVPPPAAPVAASPAAAAPVAAAPMADHAVEPPDTQPGEDDTADQILAAPAVDTRLALVEECRALGDEPMARELLNEIIADGDADARERAQKMLAELG